MKKTSKQDIENTESTFSFKFTKLSKAQSELRTEALTKISEKFAKTLAKNALGTRTDFAQQVLARLSEPGSFNWTDHGVLCIALSDIRTRDGLLRLLHDEVDFRESVCDHLGREIARADKQWIAPLATVFGGLIWLTGFPEKTRAAINLALDTDPSYSLALLLDIALRHNVPASVWSASLEAVSLEACLKGAA